MGAMLISASIRQRPEPTGTEPADLVELLDAVSGTPRPGPDEETGR
jgi:hypothetical protein